MTRRILLSLLVGAATVATCRAFTPAPVYREPPKPKVPEIFSAIQGTWENDITARRVGLAAVNRSVRQVRIQGTTWSYVTITNGVEREGVKYEIVLDPKQSPATVDLRRVAVANRPVPANGRATQFALKGIVKVEGDTMTFRYVSGYNQDAVRPKQFDNLNQLMPNGGIASTMTLRRVK